MMKRSGKFTKVTHSDLPLELSSVSDPDKAVTIKPSPRQGRMSAVKLNQSWSNDDLTFDVADGELADGEFEDGPGYSNASLYSEMNNILFGESLNRETFQALVEEKKKKYHLGQKAAEVEVVIDRLIQQHGGSMESALLAVVSDTVSEAKAVLLSTKLLYRGADADAADNKTRTPIHYAARRGYVVLCERLLEFGASATRVDIDGVSPLSITLRNKHDKLTALFIHHTKSDVIRSLFSQKEENSQSDYSLHGLIKDKSMKMSVKAVLDCMIDTVGWTSSESVVHYSMLESDTQGYTPDDAQFQLKDRTCLQLIAQTGDQNYISHPVVRLLVRRKWVKYARNRFIVSGLAYLVAIAFLTAAVILSLDSADPLVYSVTSAADIARAVCEGVVALFIISTLIQEAFEAIKLGKDYFLDWFNYLDLAATFMLILVIPLRLLNLSAQWGVYSAGYLLSVLRVFQYSAIFRRQRAYSQIIFRMATKEFVDFLIMFCVIMLAFTGSFAMALRIDGTLSSTNNIRTSSFWNILLTSARVLIEDGPVLDYFNDQGHVYGWYATILFLAFLFVCMVMLMNILIAQLSETYESMKRNAQLEVTLNRAWIVARVELNSVPFGCQQPHCKHYAETETIGEEELRLFQSEIGYKEDTNKLINKLQLQLHDVDLSARSIRNRQRNQDLVLTEILSLLKRQRPDVNSNLG